MATFTAYNPATGKYSSASTQALANTSVGLPPSGVAAPIQPSPQPLVQPQAPRTIFETGATPEALEAERRRLAVPTLQPPTGQADIINALDNYLKRKSDQGLVINPNVKLDEKTLADFMVQAEREINPYYATQLKLSRETLLRTLGYSRDEILRQEQDAQRKYKTQLRTLGETSAEQGFALSGIRQRGETELAEETQQSIEQARQKATFEAGTLARTFAQQYGTPQVPTQTLPPTPRVIPGEPIAATEGPESPFFELSPETFEGLIGEKEFARRGAVRTRASELEKARRTLLAL